MKRSWIRRQFRTFERWYRWWSFRFTPGGKAVSLLAVYSIPAIMSFDDAMPFVGICAIITLLMTKLLGRVFRPRLDVELRSPLFATVDQPFMATAHITNLSDQAALDIIAHIPTKPTADATWLPTKDLEALTIDGNATVPRPIPVTPFKRGLHRLPAAEVLTVFPLNLIRRPVTRTEGNEVVVLPKVLPVTITQHESVSQMLGLEQRLLATAGGGFDYLGSREYVEGPVRRWDYASWARLGQPVVREFAEEADRQISIVVDTSVHSRKQARDTKSFERYITCVFSLVEHLLNDEIEIALCVVGESVTHETARPGNFGHRTIRKLIATAQPTRDASKTASNASLLARHADGPALVFLPEWNDFSEELLKGLKQFSPGARPVLYDEMDDTATVADAVRLRIVDGGIQLR